MRKPVINPGIINRLKMLFAIVQDGDTATRNIAKGKCVIWKNTPCRAITDISTGDTLSSVNLSTDDEGYINSVENNISNLQDGIAIVANNNTHPSVSLGQFVYVKNHDTLAEGLYKASSNIAVTDPLSTSNLVADDSGGLNALKSDVDTLSSKIPHIETGIVTITVGAGANKTIDVQYARAFSEKPCVQLTVDGEFGSFADLRSQIGSNASMLRIAIKNNWNTQLTYGINWMAIDNNFRN